jgi:hypothetical protein
MSSYIVDASTIALVVQALSPRATTSERTQLGRDLFALNEEAFAALYGAKALASDTAENGLESKSFVGRADLAIIGAKPVALYKALREFTYQCHEGNVPETELYKRVRAAKYAIACEFIESSAGFDA